MARWRCRLGPQVVMAVSGVLASAFVLSGCDVASSGVRFVRHLLGSGVRHKAVPPQPIPSAPTARTRRIDAPLLKAWVERNLLGAYDRVGLKNPLWDAEARAFIERASGRVMGYDPPGRLEDLLQEGGHLLDLGCNDPLVLYLHGRHLVVKDGCLNVATETLRQSVDGMKSVPYPRAVARYAASALKRCDTTRNVNKGWRAGLADLEARWFKESLADGSFRNGDQVVLASALAQGTGPDLLRRSGVAVAAEVSNLPWADKWLRLFVAGEAEAQQAYKARGTGWADEVSEADWKLVRQHAVRARENLTRAWQLRPDRPEAAAQMAYLVNVDCGAGESVRMWFDRAVAAQMDYWPAYDAMITSLRDRWGGGTGELFGFARECAATQRFDTIVPSEALEVATTVASDEVDDARRRLNSVPMSPAYGQEPVYHMLAQVLGGYIGEAVQSPRRAYWESRFACTAFGARRYREAREHLHAAGGHLALEIPHQPEWPASRWESAIEVLGDESVPEARAAEDLLTAGQRSAALQRFRAAERRLGGVAAARPYLQHRIATLALEEDLGRGQWVKFLPQTTDFAGWMLVYGEWRLEPDGALWGTFGASGSNLLCASRVGANFEIRGEIETATQTARLWHGGILFGYPEAGSSAWLAFRIGAIAGGPRAWLSRGLSIPAHHVGIPLCPRNRFHLQFWNGRVNATVNDTVVVRDYLHPGDGYLFDEGTLVGLGGYLDEEPFAVRYRNVELRRLSRPPAPEAKHTATEH
jgi:hypothetical protein